jgi:N-acetylglucosamine kinase-like BadF-type ATPase
MIAEVLAVDVGNSKTDLALVAADGSVLAAVRGPTASHQRVGMAEAVEVIARLVGIAAGPEAIVAGGPVARILACCAAGVDLPSDERAFGRALRARGLGATALVLNDTLAVLRSGSERRWGVAIVCGSGVNCAGRAPDGRTYRIPALGAISGDWGGGQAVGEAGLAAAVRARDGRGPRTSLETTVPAAFGLRRPIDVTLALYGGRLDEERLGELAPAVFGDASAGDPVARAIVDRLADELATMATAAIRRLRLARTDADVVLGGGIFLTDDAGFHERLVTGVLRVAPHARIRRLDAPPVVGAALLGLDSVEVAERAAVEAKVRRGLTQEAFRGG